MTTGTVVVYVSQTVLPTSFEVAITPVSGGMQLSFTGIPGQEYLFQRSTDLMSWTTINTQIAGVVNRTVTYMDPTQPGNSFFYRVLAP